MSAVFLTKADVSAIEASSDDAPGNPVAGVHKDLFLFQACFTPARNLQVWELSVGIGLL